MTNPGPPGALAQLVPPTLREVLRAQDLRLARPIWGRRQGWHRSRRAGVGHDFRDHRPYVAGDDLRMLDWRAAARRDGLVLRQTEAERELSIALLIDGGGGMAYGEGDQNKWSVAGSFAGALTWMALRQTDRVGFGLGRGSDVDHSALRPSGAHARGRALVRAFTEHEPAGRCPWRELLSVTSPRLARRSLVIAFSDFWDVGDSANDDPDAALDELLGSLGHLRSRGHDVVMIQILHRDELTFPWQDRRVYRFEDLGNARPAVEGPAASLRDAYLEKVDRYLERLETDCEREGLFLHPVVTDEPIADAFLGLLARLAGRADPRVEAEVRP